MADPETDRQQVTDQSDDERAGLHKRAEPLLPPSIAGESIADLPPEAPMPASDAIVGSSDPSTLGASADGPPVVGAGASSVSGGRARAGDRVFNGLATGSGVFVVALVVLVGVYLLVEAIPAISKDKVNFLTSRAWNVTSGPLQFGIAGLLYTTILVSIIAMIIAVPISVGIALFMTQYAPRSLFRPIAYIIDLLAAIPSIIYGIWGVTILSPKLKPVQRALYHLGGFPIFKDDGFITGSVFDGGIVLAIMILPIITAISRDVFERTPRQHIEAAYALGATKWEVIRTAVLPYGRPGVISGSMLGLGRALGETIAILLIVSEPSSSSPFSTSIFNGGQTFAAKIASDSAEFPLNPGPYIAAGLVLFILTFIVNAAARTIVNRRKDFR